ncbi:beta strand repeat-containing protein [Frigoriglobus tundricola]|uniref:Right handed beta helix domain-containing protein n=1 Tax=Frigoriglobus tundricola TaxID=2774151 RepID=A0A6M5YRQ8_9BACT|nr:FG-GAP-like repeat-containing protein [Frigoriglobus tundricola]QJW96678.1 hypothetical protein FTUN_4235 [Frigoriglobus tundricola]
MSVHTRGVRRGTTGPDRARHKGRLTSRCPLRVEALEERWLPSTYFVNSLADTNTPGTLRYEINLANTNNTGTAGTPDQIQFTTGAGTISVTGSALPTLTDIAVIDGTTATGYVAAPVITLDGTAAGPGASGLTISGGSSTVKGLDIVNFAANGILLTTNGGDTLLNNYIGVTTANVVAANGANGVFISGTAGNTLGGTGATSANVISGNGGDGVRIDGTGATNNLLVANFIGTNATGTSALGNAGNGVQITNGARLNTIGGSTPTATPFTGKPVDGNVISGNGTNGVLITTGAAFNTLSGNFIGTNLAGTSALGNVLDGVAIVNGANNNSLIGTTFPQQPFVYLNVLAGNGGNGLRIQDSNNTTVQANSFGLGDDNITPVANHLDGVLIAGSSANTQFGGVIPLGNIVAGNAGNGVEIRDTASGTVCFNTFCGLPAFTDTAVGNALDGFLITSTGGNTLLRTNVISGNVGNGVHISGAATGVQVEEDIIGMNTNGQMPLGNGANGVLIDGTAHGNSIGGFQVSVITQNTISANGADGIAIVGSASANQVFHSFIGTNILGVTAFGNVGAGVFVGGSAQGTIIGGTDPFDQDVISSNGGGGIVLSGASQGTQVIGSLIGTDRTGLTALANRGNGISITSSDNQIGGLAPAAGNVIAFNTQSGVAVASGTGNGILGNSIFGNAALGIALSGGGNQGQPAPVLTAASSPTAAAVRVTGTLTAAANTTYRIEFFASSRAPTGQGQTSLGYMTVTTGASGVAPFTFNSTLPVGAGASITATATDPGNNTSAFSGAITATEAIFAVGSGPGGVPLVKVYNGDGTLRGSFLAFDAGFRGGVTVAVGDLSGDGVEDIIVGAGPGAGPAVAVYSGTNFSLLGAFFAFDPGFRGGVTVAAGDLSGDGRADIIVGAGPGAGPAVAVYSGTNFSLLGAFFAFDPGFRGGVTVAAGDLSGDGRADIIVGAGPGAGPAVAVYSGSNFSLLGAFFAFDPSFSGGVTVAVGEINGVADIIVGAGAGAGPAVAVYSGTNFSLQGAFFAFDPGFRGGVTVATDVNDGEADIIVGAGPGAGPAVAVYSGTSFGLQDSFFAFDPSFSGGVFVG